MDFTKEIIDLSGLDDNQIKSKLSELNIALTPKEGKKIQNEMLGRPPSLAELVLFSIQGSEHCSYKSSRNHLKQFITEGPDVVLGAKEDAGVVAITTDKKGHRWCVVMSHESHNHPSQIVPYEGAATGVGGNVRDVMCMGAEVIACSDSFRFGEIDSNKTKWIHDGVVAGVAGYGNPLGIPNIGGDIYYDSGYNDNCLVTLVTLGIVREDHIIHSYAPKKSNGYDLILLGKPTDNSGFGGASFASLELEEEKKEQNKGAVQEPNAFLERHLLKSTYSLFKYLQKNNLCEKVGFKDLGAGGVACASVELAETSGYGSEIWLDKVHVGMNDLHPSVYLCSETQERFMWVSPPELTQKIVKHYNQDFDLPNVSSGAKASVIGKIKDNKMYVVYNNDEKIVDALAKEVTKGFIYDREYENPNKVFEEPKISTSENLNVILKKMISHENIASRAVVFESYDKQVQGRTIIESGMSDAGVMAPFNSDEYPEEIRKIGIALSTDHNPNQSKINPYLGGVNATLEAMRNVTAVGATPHALSDCLCFGNPEKPHQMWEFVEAVRGVSDACKGIKLKEHPNSPTPIIAGNVSFYNESKSNSIPPSPIISCLGKMDNVDRAITMSFKKINSKIFMVGKRKDELGGSLYYNLFGELGANVPNPDLNEVKNQIYAITDCIDNKLIESCHDISDGGIAVALSEMTFENNIGCSVTIPGTLPIEKLIFSETGGFIIEVEDSNTENVKEIFNKHNINLKLIGETSKDQKLVVNNAVNMEVEEMKSLWTNGLRDKIK